MKAVFWLGITFLTQISRSVTFQAIKNLYAHLTYLCFGQVCKFFGDFQVYLEINSFSQRISTPSKLNELVDCYNRTLTSILDKHAPLQRKSIPQRRRTPWYNDQILTAKRLRRKAEKKGRLSNSTHDLTAYKSARNFATNLIKKARFEFYHNLIQENSSDQGKLFRISKQLLNQNSDVPLPPHSSKAMLANEMANSFVEKISDIRSKFKVCK